MTLVDKILKEAEGDDGLKELAAKTTFNQFMRMLKMGNLESYGVSPEKLTDILGLQPNDPAGNMKKAEKYYYTVGKEARAQRKQAKKDTIAKKTNDNVDNIFAQALKQSQEWDKLINESVVSKKVYHQTNAEFNQFDNSMKSSGQGNDFGGIWFSDTPNYFAERKKKTIEAYIDIQNPAREKDLEEAQVNLPANLYKDPKAKSKWYTEYFKSKGFDGIIAHGEYAVFDSSQIKIFK